MHTNTGLKIVAVSLFASLLAVVHGCARSAATLGVDEARNLYDLSHISPQFDVAHEFLDAQLTTYQATWSPEQLEIAARVIDESLSAENVTRKVLERLEAQPDPHFMNAVFEWLHMPETRRILAATAATTNPKAIADFKDFMAGDGQLQPSEDRLGLIERYDTAARFSSDSIGSLRLAIYGAAEMSDALAASDARTGADASRQFAEQRSKLLEPVFKELSALTLRFAFRGMSDAEVATFVGNSESEPMQWYYRTLSTVFLGTLEEIANDLGTAFTTALESQPDA